MKFTMKWGRMIKYTIYYKQYYFSFQSLPSYIKLVKINLCQTESDFYDNLNMLNFTIFLLILVIYFKKLKCKQKFFKISNSCLWSVILSGLPSCIFRSDWPSILIYVFPHEFVPCKNWIQYTLFLQQAGSMGKLRPIC